MQPTLNPDEKGKPRHEWVLVNRFPCKSFHYNHGDIVMFRYILFQWLFHRSPKDPKRYLVKRIIGLPGDWVQLQNNKLVWYDDVVTM